MTTLEFPPDVGGVGESVKRISHLLMGLGYEVHIAVFRAVFREEQAMAAVGDFRCPKIQTQEQNGLTVHRLYPAVRSPQAKQQDYLCDLYDRLQALHCTYSFDLLHSFFISEMGFLTTLLGQENDIPVINSIRGADLHKHAFSPQLFSQITWTLANSTWTTFVSRQLMHRARTLVPDIRKKSSAFWNSIDPLTFYHPSPLTTHLPANPPANLPANLRATAQPIDIGPRGAVIGTLGNFRDKKGLEYLFEACEMLRENDNIMLLLIGDFADKERAYWEQTLERSGFRDRTIVTGKVSRQKALAYLSYIDIVAIPSIHDGCPNALLEAMLLGKAVVGTPVDAIGEIIEEGVNGLLVEPGNSKELAEALRRLVAQPTLRQQLGIAARQKALSQLRPEVEQQNWEKVYQKVLGQRCCSLKANLEVV